MKLQTRILTGFAAVMALFVGLGIGVVVEQRNQLTSQLDARLESVVPLRPPSPVRPENAGNPEDIEPVQPLQEPISDVYIAMKLIDGTIEVVVQGQLLDTVPDIATLAPISQRTFVSVNSVDGSTSFRVLADPAGVGGDTVFIAVPATDVDATVQRLVLVFVTAALLVAILLALISLWVVRLGFRPISAMTETARAITAGDTGERAPELDDRTEAGQLAAAFNVMLDQRAATEDKLRRFVSDASHELRTPLTSILGYLELYADGGFREPGQLDDVVRRMRSEAGRMSSLIESLLQLARLDEEQPLNIAEVEIDRLIGDVVASAIASHPGRSVQAELSGQEEPVEIDEHKIGQLVAALVDNALTHAPNASVLVKVIQNSNELLISVIDDGPGLSLEETERVFDRFYRGDPARARTSGGSGLGLGIAKSIAQAHGGELSLTSSPGEGCNFALRIPVHGEHADSISNHAG